MHMLRKLDTHRGRDSWCWPKEVRPLGFRPSQTWAFAVCFICRVVFPVFKMAASTVTTSWHNETSWSAAVTSWHDETTSGKDDTTKTRRNEKLRRVHEELTRQVKMSIRSPHSHLRYLLYLRLLELQIMGMDLVSSVFQPFSVAVVWNCLHLLCKEDTCHFSVRSILRIRKKSGIRYKFCYSRLP